MSIKCYYDIASDKFIDDARVEVPKDILNQYISTDKVREATQVQASYYRWRIFVMIGLMCLIPGLLMCICLSKRWYNYKKLLTELVPNSTYTTGKNHETYLHDGNTKSQYVGRWIEFTTATHIIKYDESNNFVTITIAPRDLQKGEDKYKSFAMQQPQVVAMQQPQVVIPIQPPTQHTPHFHVQIGAWALRFFCSIAL